MGWDIVVPKMDANITKAKVISWLVREGEPVRPGMPLVEIETEKAVFVIESEMAGVLGRIVVRAPARVPVGTRLGEVVDTGTAVDTATDPAPPAGEARASLPGLDDAYAVDDYDEALFE